MKGFLLHISAAVPALLLLLTALGWGREALLAVLFSAIHEGGHLAAALLLGYSPAAVTFGFFGGALTLKEGFLKPYKELVLHLAGPFCNLALALLLWLWILQRNAAGLEHGLTADWLFPAFWINLSLALFNLLPLWPLDGGKALSVYLVFFFGQGRAGRISWYFSVLFAFFLFLLGIFLVQYNKADLLISAAGIRLFLVAREERQQAFLRTAESLWRYAALQ
ncbi:MAG: hypothetical protein E7223_02625 [Clostridiales bacterium]|nr:hypothetical protein [Clostridiales bacterium]